MKKKALIVLLLAFALFASLWTYVQSDAFALKIRPLIAEPLQLVLGHGAAFGRIKASLLPLSLEVRDIVIPGPGNREMIAIRRVRVYLNPFPLLYKTISVTSIAMLEPRISTQRSSEGGIDLAELASMIKANVMSLQGTGAPAYSVQIRTVTIRNGKAVLVDASSRTTVTMTKLNLKVKMSLPNSSFNARLASSDLTIAAPAIGEIKGQMRGIVNYAQGRLSLDGCQVTAEDARIAASGSIGLMTDRGLNLKITSRIGQRSIGRITDILERGRKAKGPVIDTTLKIAGTINDPVMSGSVGCAGISIRGVHLNEAEARFTYQGGNMAFEGGPWKLTHGSRQFLVQTMTLDASYQGGRIQVRRAAVSLDDLTLSATGSVGTADGYQLALTAVSTAPGRSLSMLSGFEISGSVSVDGTVSGPLELPRFDGQVAASQVIVRGVLFRSASGDVTIKDKKISITGADIRQGSSRYDFSGSIDFHGPDSRFQAKLDAFRSDVASIVTLFYTKIPLELSATGELLFSGTGREFSGTAHLDLDAGTAYGESFDRGSLTVELTTNRISFPRVQLEKKDGSVSGSGWIGFDGTYDAHVVSEGQDLSEVDHLKLLSCSGPFILDIRSTGSFSAPVVRAYAESERLSYRQFVLGSARVDLVIENAMLTLSGLTSDRSFSVNGSWNLKPPYPWSLTANVRLQDISPASMYAGSDLLAKAKIDADGTIEARGKGIDLDSIEGTTQIHKLGLTYGDLHIQNEGAADVRFAAGRVFVNALTLTGPGTKLSVTGGSHLGQDVDLTFTGDANLSLLRILFREVDHGDGAASVKLTVSDDWANPDIAGELTIRNGLIKIRDIPQRFTALNGTIGFSNGRVVTEALSGEVGGGTITVAGNAQLDGIALVDFSTKASIDNVTVRYPAGLTANVGGILYYDGDDEAQTLSGEVLIRKARFEKRVEWKSMLVDFSKGFTQKKKADIGWIGETQLGVRFIGKENILFESNLAKIPLHIDMLIQGTVNQPQVLGRIEARKGEVYFRKNVFKILHASTDFTDPNRINPTLDVRAETRVREYQIQLGVTGTADRAVVTFVSEPPLTDANILALLTLGRKGEELKGKEASVGVGEATSFATGKFQDILESRARSLTGLDRFQVDPYISKTDTAVPRITVGKELVQEKLFMTYSSNVGATYPEQVFRIEYILNRNVSLVGDRNELGNLGADVKFRFEFR